MKLRLFLTSLFALNMIVLNAGTIIYKTSKKGEQHTLAKVKIVSIAKKTVTIKHGKGVRTIPLSYLIGYYDTNISTGSFADNTCDYIVSIRDIKIPKTGYTYTKIKKKKNKTKSVSNFEISFAVNKKQKKGQSKVIRMPYFYLFVMTTRSKSYGQRPVYTYYYPDEAKVKSNTYDEAKIIEAITSMDRPRIYPGGRTNFGNISKLSSASGYKPVIIPMKGIKNQRIIAYHLEIWGKNKIITQKDWHESVSHKVGKNWWKRY
ncbi:MAG: hypothetical protein KOO69_05985 [Victivallales bacterium]|nr:hypothetical protein [Victivallales bacterium]